MTAAQRNTERTAAAWLQARGWRRSLGGQWAHDALGHRRDAAAAVQAQTRHEHTQARTDRDHDMAVVAKNAGEDWLDAAVEAVRRTAALRETFTTDHVLEDNPELPEPHEPRAWGPALIRARDAGIVVSTGSMVASSRRSSNARAKLAWRSLIMAGVPAEAVPT